MYTVCYTSEMNNTHTPTQTERNVALGLLVALFLISGIFIVIPSLKSVKQVPMQYFNELPVSDDADFDRDGIPNNRDGSPFPVTVKVEELDTESGATLSGTSTTLDTEELSVANEVEL